MSIYIFVATIMVQPITPNLPAQMIECRTRCKQGVIAVIQFTS